MKKKDTETTAYAYGVFRDENRHTCIRVKDDGARVHYIPMEAAVVEVHSMAGRDFKQQYEAMTDYPVKRAAEHYLFHGGNKTISPAARKHLETIVADPANAYDSAQFKTVIPKKEPDMATKSKASPAAKAAPAKKSAGKAAAAAAPTKTKAKPAAAEGATARRGRTSAVAGKTIKVVKGAPFEYRDGSKRAALLKAVMVAGPVEAVIGTEVEGGAKVSAQDVKFAAEQGLITLS